MPGPSGPGISLVGKESKLFRDSAITVMGILLLLSLGLTDLSTAEAAPGPDSCTLFIYLEVPTDYSIATTLTLASLELRAGSEAIPLTPRRRQLVAAELAGRQILLAQETVAAGHYDSLIMELGLVVAAAGQSIVEPPLRASGYVVATDVHLSGENVEVINLVWQPQPVPVGNKSYNLDLHTTVPPVPPLGSLAFVSEQQSGSVLVVDRVAGRVVAGIAVGDDPRGMAYSAPLQKLYVAVAGEDGIAVVDALTLRLERTMPLNFGDNPDRMALDASSATLFVLNEGSRSLAAIATRSMQEIRRTTVGDGPRAIAVDPVQGTLYVACEFEGEVQSFHPGSLVPRSTLTMITAPVEVVFAGSERRLYVTGSAQNRIHGFDLETGGELGAQSLCGPARHLAFNSRAQQLFAAIASCDEVAVLRPANGLEFAPISLNSPPGRLCFDAGQRTLLVIMNKTATLAIHAANRGTLTSVVEIGGTPNTVIAP